MDKKRVIKLNENDEYLSLGNIFRLIKEMAIDSSSFLQTDLFSIIFDCDVVANSTVNNYCTGQRAINAKYKNYMLEKRKAYLSDNNSFTSEVGTILNLINTGKFETINMKIEQINNDTKFKYICSKLYTISKNDIDVNSALSNKLFKYLNSNNLYNFFVEALFFAVLERVQPIYKENAISDLIEKNLVNTNISVANIEKFMKLQLKEGIWSIRGISELAKENNPFACFEMASLEFYGVVSGKPRYEKAYDYYKIAAKNSKIEFIGSVATLIVEDYEKENLLENMSKDIAILLMSAILDNTLNFQAKVTNERDRIAYKKLQKIANVEDNYAEKYFLECQQNIERDLKMAIENDTKVEKICDLLPTVFSQLTLWNKEFILDNNKIVYETLNHINKEWMMNLISLEDAKSYIIAEDTKVQAGLERLFNESFEDDILELENVWLRKEIIKKARNID